MFRESDHPRDNDGKFTDGNGESGKSRSEKMIEAVKKYSDSPEKDLGGDADAIWDKPKAGTDKSVQLGIINATNPAPDDYHTWIRSEEDIKTPEEVYQSALDDGFEAGDKITPDFTMADWKNALDSGYITVYSSMPIKNGNFVSTSKLEASQYAGDNRLYSAKVPISNVAWIDALQGQFAKL